MSKYIISIVTILITINYTNCLFAYNNDFSKQEVTVNITFKADLTELLNEGFVPGIDTIEVVGDTPPLSWMPPGIVLNQDLINPTIFLVTISFTGNPGSLIQWKFHCDPMDHFTYQGWEPGDNRTFNLPYSDTTIGPLVPLIHVSVPIFSDNTVYFRVNINGAHERYHNTLITGLSSVWIGGSELPLQWPANWTFPDTANGTLSKMYDDGTHSDSIAGDKIFSNLITFPPGTPSSLEFKYCAVFSGVDTLNGGTRYLDNEAGLNENHFLGLNIAGGTVYRYNLFGDQVVPVEFIGFSANVNYRNVVLNWQTATEINNKGFEVQRLFVNHKFSINNLWERIGFVNGSGTTTETQSYSFKDINLQPGKYSYRLKQVDFDGTYKYSDVVDVEVEPAAFSLSQNYPNPFNPTTNIQYQIPNRELVTLKVYDVLGNEVATLVNEEKQAGNYSVKFNGSNLASGIYFYKLSSGNFVQTRKMILLK